MQEPSYGARHDVWRTPAIRAPITPRRPLLWAYFTPKVKRLYLLRKALLKAHYTYPLFYKTKTLDFVAQIAAGKTLLVGEGNLSFTVSLMGDTRMQPDLLTASTFELLSELSPEAKENAKKLRGLDIKLRHGVDATELSSTFGAELFDNIVFQFPHEGTRDPVEGRNPNFILVRDFLKSVRRHLARGGKVLISAVDSSYYRGAFQFEEAAKIAGFQSPEAYPFDPSKFRGYHHTMIHQDGSALENHDQFATWIFKPKT